MSYIRRFWTPNSEAALFKSKEFSMELRKICTNFLVSRPREESYLELDKGVPPLPLMDNGLARDDRAEDAEPDSSIHDDRVIVGESAKNEGYERRFGVIGTST